MRRFMVLFALAGTASCASSGSTPETGVATPSDRVVAMDNHAVYRTTVQPNAKVPIPVAPSRAFDALKAVYEELGVPAGTYDPATGRVGNNNFWKIRKLGTESLSTYLNCGDSFSGSIADTYRVYISVMSVVRPDGTGASELETSFTAQAQNNDGSASDKVACGTTGRLEERIRKALLLKVGAPPS